LARPLEFFMDLVFTNKGNWKDLKEIGTSDELKIEAACFDNIS